MIPRTLANRKVIQLKKKLQELKLPTTGNKAELLERLHEADPSGGWLQRDIGEQESATASQESQDEVDTETAEAVTERGTGIYDREKELAERELQMMRREIELLRREQRLNVTNQDQRMTREDVPRDIIKASITSIADLLGHFEGDTSDYENWELQLRLLKKTYCLTDDYVRILIGMRLKGKASEWFRSKAEHIELPVEDLLFELREMYDHRPSKVKLRKRFEERVWKRDETFHQYVHEKVILANRVPIADDEVVEYIIDGIPVASLRDQARIVRITTKALLLKAFENVMLKDKTLANNHGNTERRRQSGGDQRQSGGDQRQQSGGDQRRRAGIKGEKKEATDVGIERRCFNCGQRDHVAADCPTRAEGPKCFQCSERGHIAAKCEKKQNVVRSVEASASKKSKKYIKNVSVNGCPLVALIYIYIYTGSDISLMCASAYVRLGCPQLKLKTIRFRGVGVTDNTTLGEFNTELTVDGHTYPILIRVVSDTLLSQDLLVGTDFLNLVELTIKTGKIAIDPLPEQARDNDLPEIMQINLDFEDNDIDVSHVSESRNRQKIRELVRDYEPNKTREIDLKMSIVLRDDEPVYQRARRLAIPEKELVNAQINEWLSDGIIQPSLSDYASPIVLTKKKDGSSRLCVNFRQLNKKIIKDRYPLPLIEDQLDLLQSAKLFSTLDLRNGFFHVEIDKASQKYTAFITPDGHYEFLRVPFGLCNSPAIFQRFINVVFRDLIRMKTVLTYLDDLIIPSIDVESGIEKLELVLRVASEAGLIINWKKCNFLKKRVEFLGHIIEDGYVYPSECKIEAIKSFPEPTSIKHVQSFLGLSGYFRKFIAQYSIIARPLSNLLRANSRFEFSNKERNAFLRLKEILCSKSVLKLYQIDAETELHTDASIYGFGAILLQRSKTDNAWHPIYYSSHKTTSAEQRYLSYELEVLAIVKALKKFRIYLLGIPFTIVTDCRAFVATMNKKELCVRVARWALLLEQFQYKIVHRPGKNMQHVDALSRNPFPECNLIDQQRDGLTARLKKAQIEDSDIRKIFEMVESGKTSDYIIRGNLLFRENNGDMLLVVPRKMQSQIIRQAHEKGHFSVAKTEAILRKDYWIPSVRSKIERIIRNCVICILTERKHGKQEGYLNPIAKGEVPLDTYHIDHLGPLPSTKKNYKHILVVIDAFSKFVWLYATKTVNTSEALDKLRKQAIVFGNPRRIISDRGTAFTSNDFSEYCVNENIEHTLITTGVPRGNGQVERVNRTLIPLLAKLADPNRDTWYKYLELAQQYLNTTVHRSTGVDSFHLMFGTRARLRDDPEIRRLIENEWIEIFQKERDELRERAIASMEKVQLENRRTFNKKRTAPASYKEGDLVAIKRTQQGPGLKLAVKFLGPYKVTKVLRGDRYLVQREDDGEGPYSTSTSSENMKPWLPDISDSESDSESDSDCKQ